MFCLYVRVCLADQRFSCVRVCGEEYLTKEICISECLLCYLTSNRRILYFNRMRV